MPDPIRYAVPPTYLTAPGVPLAMAALISGQPIGLDQALYEQGPVKAGLWRSCGYIEFYENYPCDAFMVVLEGEVTLESEAGAATFRAGDCFLLPQGFRGTWRQPGDMLKYFMIVS